MEFWTQFVSKQTGSMNTGCENNIGKKKEMISQMKTLENLDQIFRSYIHCSPMNIVPL